MGSCKRACQELSLRPWQEYSRDPGTPLNHTGLGRQAAVSTASLKSPPHRVQILVPTSSCELGTIAGSLASEYPLKRLLSQRSSNGSIWQCQVTLKSLGTDHQEVNKTVQVLEGTIWQ